MFIDFVACGLLYILLPFVSNNPYAFMIVVTVAFFCTGPMFAFFPPLTAIVSARNIYRQTTALCILQKVSAV